MENEDVIIRKNSFYDTDSELGINPRTEEEFIEYKRLIGMPLTEDYEELMESLVDPNEEKNISCYKKNKQLIQENIIPHLSGKLFISESVIYLSQTDTIKLLHSLKNELPSSNYFLYEEINNEYVKQVHDSYILKNYSFNFSLMPYARRHGLVKQLKKSINK